MISHAKEICKKLKNISISDLLWRDAIANQVINDDSDLVKNLGKSAH